MNTFSRETVTDNHEKYLWGNTAFTFATRLTDSFAKWRWCPNIIGPKGGGAVENLPIHTFEAMGEVHNAQHNTDKHQQQHARPGSARSFHRFTPPLTRPVHDRANGRGMRAACPAHELISRIYIAKPGAILSSRG